MADENSELALAGWEKIRYVLNWLPETLETKGWEAVRSTDALLYFRQGLTQLLTATETELQRRGVEGF